MVKKGRPKKAQVEVDIDCPWCRKGMHVQVFRDIVEPAVPAVVELVPVVEKDTQGRLFDEGEKPDEKSGKAAVKKKGSKKGKKGVKAKAPKKKKKAAKKKKKGKR